MISIICPIFNEENILSKTIPDFQKLSSLAELIFIDGGSTDRSRELAKTCGRVLLCQKGRPTQMNCGARQAQGDIFLFLHADAMVPAHSLRSIESAVNGQGFIPPTEDHACLTARRQACKGIKEWSSGWDGAVQTPIPRWKRGIGEHRETTHRSAWGSIAGCLTQRIDNPAPVYRWIEAQGNFRARTQKIFYGDQGIFVRKDVFFSMGGFPDVPILEDVLLTRKLRAAGKTIVLPDKITVSARRWESQGIIKTAAIYSLIILLWRLKVPLDKIARLHESMSGHIRQGT